MAHIAEIGSRIELVSMDKYFQDISLGLYEQEAADGVAEYVVLSYAHMPGAAERVQFVMQAMQILGNMEATPDGRLRFACGDAHHTACKRLFIAASKVTPDAEPAALPLRIHDRKSECDYSVTSLGGGHYRITAEGESETAPRRVRAIAGGLRKLGDMTETGNDDEAAFACGASHDALTGLLLVRAPNVRAVMREEDAAAKQGVLAAPSAQNS
ncbi:MAG: hypothetical protein CMM31_08905 [Rhodospirillaceae bacterium]|nr:hypothetical protein [Rhodospirillaceae bacterium]